MILKRLSPAILIATTGLFPGLAGAMPFSIDEFNGETALTSTPLTVDGTMLGGERDVEPSTNASYSSTGGAATFYFNAGISRVNVYYDGNDNDPFRAFGLGGFDFTTGGADRFIVSISSVVSNPSLAITNYQSADDYSRSGPTVITTPGIYEFLFSSFNFEIGNGSSLANSNSLQLTISDNFTSGGPGSLTIDYLRTNGQSSPSVPEPAALSLLGLGLAALGIGRRRQRIVRLRDRKVAQGR